MNTFFRMVITFMLAPLFILPVSCSDTEVITNEKISGLLQTQINLKKEQIDNPSFHSGERAVIFLNNNQGIFTVFGGFQGKFTIDENNMVGNKPLAGFTDHIKGILARH